ncbi:hypothetical protein, unlikely [Trypanosoma brucei brucei TREU927]|uniref:Uncharacterized protein n=1 Tax=Trypanosoma brucei brucei (strain 927/4 GUTat10.1) TaxID=185431 RepID=Q38FC1_TRYB2|nr:hypothetical protein, unlikely [Trypanosoma brucei brucei TREU927]EAN76499.1 hypothetical protein, unlikely [Trypanosoma brucei brucei TREU927]
MCVRVGGVFLFLSGNGIFENKNKNKRTNKQTQMSALVHADLAAVRKGIQT